MGPYLREGSSRSSKGGYESGRDSSGVGERGLSGLDLGVHGGMCVAFAGVSSANGGTVAPSLQTATVTHIPLT